MSKPRYRLYWGIRVGEFYPSTSPVTAHGQSDGSSVTVVRVLNLEYWCGCGDREGCKLDGGKWALSCLKDAVSIVDFNAFRKMGMQVKNHAVLIAKNLT